VFSCSGDQKTSLIVGKAVIVHVHPYMLTVQDLVDEFDFIE